MKILYVLLALLLFLNLVIFSQESIENPETTQFTPVNTEENQKLDLEIGSIRIAQPFVHAQKDYEKGVYYFKVTEKNGIPYFIVHNQKIEVLFEERAVVKPNNSRNKNFKYRLKKKFVNKNEHLKINVITPKNQIMAFLKVKK